MTDVCGKVAETGNCDAVWHRPTSATAFHDRADSERLDTHNTAASVMAVKEKHMPRLSQKQALQFEENGYLIVTGVLSPEKDLDPVIREYEGVLDRLVGQLFE